MSCAWAVTGVGGTLGVKHNQPESKRSLGGETATMCQEFCIRGTVNVPSVPTSKKAAFQEGWLHDPTAHCGTVAAPNKCTSIYHSIYHYNKRLCTVTMSGDLRLRWSLRCSVLSQHGGGNGSSNPTAPPCAAALTAAAELN